MLIKPPIQRFKKEPEPPAIPENYIQCSHCSQWFTKIGYPRHLKRLESNN